MATPTTLDWGLMVEQLLAHGLAAAAEPPGLMPPQYACVRATPDLRKPELLRSTRERARKAWNLTKPDVAGAFERPAC